MTLMTEFFFVGLTLIFLTFPIYLIGTKFPRSRHCWEIPYAIGVYLVLAALCIFGVKAMLYLLPVVNQ